MGVRRLLSLFSWDHVTTSARLLRNRFKIWGWLQSVAAIAIGTIALMAGLVTLGFLPWPLANDDTSSQIERLEEKVDRLPEYLADLSSVEKQTLRAAYEEGRLLQLEGYAAQDTEKHAEAIDRFARALALAETDEHRAALHILRGNSYIELSELGAAEQDYLEALSLADVLALDTDRQVVRAAALGGLGLVYADRGDLEAAEEQHREALSIAEEIEDKLGQSTSLNNLGNVYFVRGDFEAAEEHHKRALALHQEIGNKLGQAASLGNLGIVYASRGELDKAEEYLKRALGIEEEIGNSLGQANQLGNLGNVHFLRGDLDRAESHHRRALTIDEEIGNKLGQAHDLGNLGIVAAQRGDKGKARDLLQQAAALYDVIGAGGEGPETVREALQRLEASSAED